MCTWNECERSYGEFVVQNGLKQWDNIKIDFKFCILVFPLKPRGAAIEWDTSAFGLCWRWSFLGESMSVTKMQKL